ncbi:hypothetical protein BH09BAC1_BH09BAC1_19510 [soil metagenome]
MVALQICQNLVAIEIPLSVFAKVDRSLKKLICFFSNYILNYYYFNISLIKIDRNRGNKYH